MITFLIVLNLTAMAVVFGYAVAASVVSYPAMMAVSRSAAVEYFSPFFHKSAHFQMIVSLIVLVLSLLISWKTGAWAWLVFSVILQLSGPYTIKILMPVNNRIMASGADINSEQMTTDLGRWGMLHLPRTILAAIVFVEFAWLAVVAN